MMVSDYIANRISKRRYNRFLKRPIVEQRDRYIIGFDSEADTSSDGRPMMFQFSLPETEEDDTLLVEVPPTKHAGIITFLNFLDDYCQDPSVEYLIYAWNTAYELTQLFHDFQAELKQVPEFHIKGFVNGARHYDWSVEVINDKRQIVTFRNRATKVRLLDGTAFYKISLDAAAKMLGIGSKLALGDTGLSRSTFTRNDLSNETFRLYAKRDAYITRRIGEYIRDQHILYTIPTTISAPHFAATVFRTNFLTKGLGHLDHRLEQVGLYSYHGGKNGFYVDEPTEFPSIYLYDITSAYPEAMAQLPNIELGTWELTDTYTPGMHGLYCFSGDIGTCKYGSLQLHGGQWIYDQRSVHDLWTTSYEYDQAMARGELFPSRKFRGYIFTGPENGALKDYVSKFFEIKRSATGPLRETAKLLLNSLYGKFFQKQPLGTVGSYDLDKREWRTNDFSKSYDYEAGGLYNPPIASLITGFVRAKIHRLEHKYESVMTSTDGLFGTLQPDDKDIGKDLGCLTVTKGKLRLWRERLYIFDSNDGIRKYALHGWHSNVESLSELPLAHGVYNYQGTQMITLKMSNSNRLIGHLEDGVPQFEKFSPGQFVKLPYKLTL